MTDEKAREIARTGLRPLFARPCSPEERAACDGLTDLISSALRAARAEALEEAAVMCDRYFDSHGRFIAPAIRSLKDKP